MGDFVTDKAAKSYKPHELLDERNFAQSLFGTCPFQFLVASDKLDQAKVSFKVKVPPDAKHSSLSISPNVRLIPRLRPRRWPFSQR